MGNNQVVVGYTISEILVPNSVDAEDNFGHFQSSKQLTDG